MMQIRSFYIFTYITAVDLILLSENVVLKMNAIQCKCSLTEILRSSPNILLFFGLDMILAQVCKA